MLNLTAQRSNWKIQAPAALLTVAAAIALPVLVHLLPAAAGAPWGARLLPAFLAPLVAAYLFHPAVALVAAAVAPLLNHWLTGMPAQPMVAGLTLELVLFSGLVLAMRSRWPRFWAAAPLAYITAHALALALIPASPAPYLTVLTATLTTALPGILLLTAANWLLVRGTD